ncbi:hypothetical protein ACV36C_35020, partial [Pseudomonas aeruginosa]
MTLIATLEQSVRLNPLPLQIWMILPADGLKLLQDRPCLLCYFTLLVRKLAISQHGLLACLSFMRRARLGADGFPVISPWTGSSFKVLVV